MQARTKFLLAALSTALVLAVGVGAATALRSLSITGEPTLTLNGTITFEIESGSSNAEVICNLTMTKTILRAISKVDETPMGRVTGLRFAEPRSCRVVPAGGAAIRIGALGLERPERWLIFYEEFLGTLPNITGFLVTVRRAQFLVSFRVFGTEIACLYENGERPESLGLLATVTGGIIRRLRTLNEMAAAREFAVVTRLSLFCGNGGLRVKLELTPAQETALSLV